MSASSDSREDAAWSAYWADEYRAAFRLFLRLAMEGSASAQLQVGYMHDHGEGVREDPKLAARWYRAAADQGDMHGQYNVGLCHAEGEGVARDPAAAAGWFRRAAQQGHGEAQLKLGLLYERGEGVAQSFAPGGALVSPRGRAGGRGGLDQAHPAHDSHAAAIGMSDLFGEPVADTPPAAADRPLADRLRPGALAELVGQERLLAAGGCARPHAAASPAGVLDPLGPARLRQDHARPPAGAARWMSRCWRCRR